MDKNNRIGLLLMGLVIIGFTYWNSIEAQKKAEAEKIEEEARIQDSIKNAALNPTTVPIDTPQVVITDNQIPEKTVSTAEVDTSITQAITVAVEEFYTLENEKLKLTLSSKGGRIVKAELKEYDTFESHYTDSIKNTPVKLYDTETSRFDWGYNDLGTTRHTEDQFFTAQESEEGITFTSENGNAVQSYRFSSKDPHLLEYDITLPDSKAELNWETTFVRQEKGMRSEREFTGFAFKKTNGDFKKFKAMKDGASKTESDKMVYLVQRQRFFNQTIFSTGIFQNTSMTSSFDKDDKVNIKTLKLSTEADLEAGKKTSMNILIGPNDRELLKSIDSKLVNILPKGVIGIPLVKWIAGLFNFMKPLSSNYGLIILLMTILIKLALSPLTYRSYLSQAKMAVLKPELAELKEKYGKDQQRMSQEQMKLYSKAGVNPLGGCIPSLLQIPIFFSLYYFFRTSIYFRQKPFLWAEDLSTFDSLIQLPFALPFSGGSSHLSIFAVLYGLALFVSMRTTQGMNGMAMSGGAGGPGGDMMKTQMKIMQIGMPIFLPLIFNAFPVALTFYYVCYNIINTIQTLVIKKFIINEDKIHAKIQENKKKVKKKSKFQQRLETAMKEAEKQKAAKGKNKK